MGLAKVERVEILAHASLRAELLGLLQEVGLVQLEEVSKEEVGLRTVEADVSCLDHLLHRLEKSLDILSEGEDKGLFGRITGSKPSLSVEERDQLLKSDYAPILDRIENIELERSEILSHIRFLEKEMDFLTPLAALDLPVSWIKGNDILEIAVGSIPSARQMDLAQLAEEEALWFEVIFAARRSSYSLVFYLKKEKQYLEDKLKSIDFSPLYLPESIMAKTQEGERVKDILGKDERELEEKRERMIELDRQVAELSVHRDKLAKIYDILHNEREKIASSRLLGRTEKVIYLQGWVSAEDVASLRKALSLYEEECEIFIRGPLPGEEPPVILKNPKPAEPFEVVTRLYGLPGRDSLDPTVPLAPFFFVFVGLCVSEAGYGLVVALLSLLYLKFARPKGGALQFFRLLLLLGVSNVVLGTLVGGWFGFPVRRLALIDPIQNPLSFLVLSLVLGFIQVWFGTLLNLITQVRKKNYLKGIFVQGGWLLLLPSLVVYFLTKQRGWGIAGLAGATSIVLFSSPKKNPLLRFLGGLYSLYDIAKYLGDVLSYSRLLALGLATGVIAMVVNTLAQTAFGIPWVGWVFGALIFVGGHLFNLAISFLGGFVHSMRLQFVEFFTKFFQAGGKPFKPFKLESKYAEFL